MPNVKLPVPSENATTEELIDIILRYRKELEYVLQHLDESNMPGIAGIKEDILGNSTAITQTSTDITLLAEDVVGNSAAINVNAAQITSLVQDVAGNSTQITQTADSITSLAQDVAGNSTLINQNAYSITSHAQSIQEVEGRITTAESEISQTASEIALKVSQTDYNANTIASMLSLTATTAKIKAQNIDLNGITRIYSKDNYNTYAEMGNYFADFKIVYQGVEKYKIYYEGTSMDFKVGSKLFMYVDPSPTTVTTYPRGIWDFKNATVNGISSVAKFG